MTIVKKATIVLLLFSMIPMSYISFQFYLNASSDLQEKVLSDLKGTAERQENRLDLRLAQNNERLMFIQSRSSIINNLNSDNQKGLNTALIDAKESNDHFKEVSALNLKGKVINSSNSDLVGKDYLGQEFFTQGKEKNDVNFILKEPDGSISSYLTGPIKTDDKTIGVLLIKTDNDTILSMTQDYSGLGDTGEIILVKKNKNGDAIPITPLRFNKNAAFSTYWPQDSSFPANQALKGTEAIFSNATDYRGKEIFAATRYINDGDWGMVVKIDKDEALSPLTQLRNTLSLQFLVVAVAIFFLSRYFAQFLTKPILSLQETAENLSKGQLSARANIYGNDELGELAKTFNQMATDIEISFNMLRDKVKEAKELREKLEVPSAEEEIERVEKEVKDLRKKIK